MGRETWKVGHLARFKVFAFRWCGITSEINTMANPTHADSLLSRGGKKSPLYLFLQYTIIVQEHLSQVQCDSEPSKASFVTYQFLDYYTRNLLWFFCVVMCNIGSFTRIYFWRKCYSVLLVCLLCFNLPQAFRFRILNLNLAMTSKSLQIMSLSHYRFVDTTCACLASYIICRKSLRWREIVIVSNKLSFMYG